MVGMATKQVIVRMPEELIERADERAADVGLSRNAWIVALVEEATKRPIKTRTKSERI